MSAYVKSLNRRNDGRSPEVKGHRLTAESPTGARTRSGLWIVAVLFLLIMAFSTAPTPLYPLYQGAEGFGSDVISVVYAMYAFGVLTSLLLVGHVSDWYGRKPLLLGSLLLALVASSLFVASTHLTTLLVARFVNGVAVGMLTATATAALVALNRTSRNPRSRTFVDTLTIVVNVGGLGLGAAFSGAVATLGTAPLVLPYALFGGAFLLLVPLVVLVPETVNVRRPLPRYRPQRLRVPATSRAAFWSSLGLAFVGFAVFGLFTSLAPSLLTSGYGLDSPFVAGVTAFSVFASAATAQALFSRVPERSRVPLAATLLVTGLFVITVQEFAPSYVLFLLGGTIAGAGSGTAFKAAVATINDLSDPDHHAGILANLFLGAYVGISVPVIGLGVAATVLPLPIAVTLFSAALAVLTVPVAVVHVRSASTKPSPSA